MKIMRIDMSAPGGPAVREEPLGAYEGLGGRSLTSAMVLKEVPAECHALGPENKLVIAPGLLSGTMAAMSGRLSVGCKSPLTGTIKESNAGGQAAQIIAKLGYAAIVLEGLADGPYKMTLSKDGVKFEIDESLKMLTNYQMMDRFLDVYQKNGCMISVGTAGEMRMANSTISVTDPEGRPTRHCGRGGVGAVLATKGIKVILLDGKGLSNRQPVDPEKYKDANKRFVAGLKKHPVTGEGLPAYGTNILTNIINEAGGYPYKNFSYGQWDKTPHISGETQAELEAKRGGNPTHGCHRGCVIRCSGIYNDKDGNFLSKQPEYETTWSHGGNCGIFDLDAIALMDRLDDDYGLDTIEMGSAIGVAIQAGVIPYGDAEAAINLVHEVGKGTPIGRILGMGTAATAKAFGIEQAPVVKNQAMPAYDPRAIKGIGVTYATTTMGADHTAGYAIATNILKVGGDVDPLSNEGQAELSRNLQIATAAVDATGMCLFIAFALLDQPDTFQALIDLLNAFYGWNLTADDVVAYGKSILKNEVEFNRAAGFTSKHDRLPMYFKREKLGPHDVVFDVPDEELDKVMADL